MTDHPHERARVASRIEDDVIAFAETMGHYRRFNVGDLVSFVQARHQVSPASPQRILQQLRKSGRLNYEVLNRRAALYQFIPPPDPDNLFG